MVNCFVMSASEKIATNEGATILAIGDDRTDEDLFQALPEKAWSIHVGAQESAAKYRLGSPAEVRNLLKSLSSKK